MLKVSVIIPLYNKEPHISRALNSVIFQTMQDFEIIVIDDGSTDKSAEIVEAFNDQRIRLIKQKNAGVSAARNKGIKNSKASLIAFLDADDEWKPQFLETIIQLRKKYPQAGAYITAYEIHDSSGNITKINYNAIPPSPWEGMIPSYFLTAALGKMPVSTSAICIPKEILLEYDGFQEDLWLWEDSNLWGKIALKYKFAFTHKVGSIYHIGSTNRASNKEIPIQEHPFIKYICRERINEKISSESLKDLNEYIAHLQINHAYSNINAGRRQEALKILFRCQTKLLRKKRMKAIIIAFLPLKIIQSYNYIKVGKNFFLRQISY